MYTGGNNVVKDSYAPKKKNNKAKRSDEHRRNKGKSNARNTES